MSLSDEWFNETEIRKRRRELEGVSLEEAKCSLGYFNSSAYPIAVEIAEYIFHQWSAERLALLDQKTINIIFEIWGRHPQHQKIKYLAVSEDSYLFKGTFFKVDIEAPWSDNPFS